MMPPDPRGPGGLLGDMPPGRGMGNTPQRSFDPRGKAAFHQSKLCLFGDMKYLIILKVASFDCPVKYY